MKFGYRSSKTLTSLLSSFLRNKSNLKVKPYSKKSINWLKYRSQNDGVFIQHAENLGEWKIPTTRYKADGYALQTNTIYEFMGSYWHGNPKIYKSDEFNNVAKKTMGELYKKTISRENEIKKLGYTVVTIWENDWDQMCKEGQNNVSWSRYLGMKFYRIIKMII